MNDSSNTYICMVQGRGTPVQVAIAAANSCEQGLPFRKWWSHQSMGILTILLGTDLTANFPV